MKQIIALVSEIDDSFRTQIRRTRTTRATCLYPKGLFSKPRTKSAAKKWASVLRSGDFCRDGECARLRSPR